VGCRDAIFKKYIPSSLSYSGVDLDAGENVDYVASLENGLPFDSASFDVVVALDVLEHVNNIWFACDELFRVSKHRVIAILPNAYYWPLRVDYILGREMNKYRLTSDQILDRHRWLVSHNSAVNFFEGRSSHNGWKIVEEIKIPGSRRFLLIDALLGVFSKNLTSYATLFVLEKDPLSI
jgi:SAM-dependent methyltransferase